MGRIIKVEPDKIKHIEKEIEKWTRYERLATIFINITLMIGTICAAFAKMWLVTVLFPILLFLNFKVFGLLGKKTWKKKKT